MRVRQHDGHRHHCTSGASYAIDATVVQRARSSGGRMIDVLRAANQVMMEVWQRPFSWQVSLAWPLVRTSTQSKSAAIESVRPMSRRLASQLLLVLATLLGLTPTASAQVARGEILGRSLVAQKGLQRAWTAQVQLDASRDRLATLLLDHGWLFVQTELGVVAGARCGDRCDDLERSGRRAELPNTAASGQRPFRGRDQWHNALSASAQTMGDRCSPE